MSNSHPASTAGQHPVRSGDTLQSIAQAAYGDSALWYRIAQANGLTGNADLRIGQVLNLPAQIGGSHNNVGTYAPYNPARIVGSTSPSLPTPQGNSGGGGGCGGLGQILMAVVAVVATVFTAGAASIAMAAAEGEAGAALAGAGLGGIMEAGGIALIGDTALVGGGIGAAALGGAAGSIASQLVGNAIGAQDGFSWSQVALGALSAGVGAGVGSAGFLPQTNNVIADAVVRGAVASALTQGIGVAVGLQKSFSWTNVAAAALGAGVGKAVSDAVSPALGQDFGGKLATGTLAGLAGGLTTATLRGGRISVTQVATDAFGNALGNSLAYQSNSANNSVQETELSTAQQQASDGQLGSGTYGIDSPNSALNFSFVNPAATPSYASSLGSDEQLGRSGTSHAPNTNAGISADDLLNAFNGAGDLFQGAQYALASGNRTMSDVSQGLISSNSGGGRLLIGGSSAADERDIGHEAYLRTQDMRQRFPGADPNIVYPAYLGAIDAELRGDTAIAYPVAPQAAVEERALPPLADGGSNPILGFGGLTSNDLQALNGSNLPASPKWDFINRTGISGAAYEALDPNRNLPVGPTNARLQTLESLGQQQQAAIRADVIEPSWGPDDAALLAVSGVRLGAMALGTLVKAGRGVLADIIGEGANSAATAGAPYRGIVGQVPGRVLSESDALTVGPLGNDLTGLPGTFSGGRYATMQLDQPMTVYRAWAPGQSREFGAFWSLEQPAGSLQTRIDSALLPEWGNVRGTPFNAQATQYTTIQLPAGTTVHIGEIGSQGGSWVGGKSQLLIDGGAQPAWKIGESPLK